MEVELRFPFVSLRLTDEERARFAARFRRSVLDGPCIIVARGPGLALDIGWDQEAGWSPWFWETHALTPQQWTLERVAQPDVYTITHVGSGLRLQAPEGTRGQPTVARRRDTKRQRWQVVPTDDRTAFLLRSSATGAVLDATQDPARGSHPVVWDEHWEPWQQWVIARLPMSPGS